MHLTKFRASNETRKFKERLRVISRAPSCLSRNESHELLGAGAVGTVQGGLPKKAAFFSDWRLIEMGSHELEYGKG